MPQMTPEEMSAILRAENLQRMQAQNSTLAANLMNSDRKRLSVVQEIFDAVGVRPATVDEARRIDGLFVKTHNNPRNGGRTADFALVQYLFNLGVRK